MTNVAQGNPWLVAPAEAPKSGRILVCFPSAGSGASMYRQWPDRLSGVADVLRIQPPGRETRFREPLLTTLEPYLDQLVDELAPHLDRPFLFFGHSMGSIIAYRVALRLREQLGIEPEHLLVSAFRSPHAPPMKRIHHLADPEFVRELIDTYDGVPEQLLNEPEVLELMLPIVRADLAVVSDHRYEASSAFSCPISAFGGVDDRWVDEAQLGQWCVHTTSTFNLQMISGNHYYINSNSDDLIDRIKALLR